jgi:hypothetical protein
MMKKPINLKFNGMSQRQAEAIAGNTIGHVVDHFRRAAAEETQIAAAAYEQEAAMDQVAQWEPLNMGGLYDDEGEARSPLGFLDDIPFSGGFDCYGNGFKSFRI